ncbi:hypothetical protein DABAL43B_1133 [Psychrobacter sp. DAB_AL43B]|nr:hypothetical protein DABAL43B_1133 [Psychrobacter sp. DAB_AL43B]
MKKTHQEYEQHLSAKDMDKLDSKYISPPEFGELIMIADGVLWTRFKIPAQLNHSSYTLKRIQCCWDKFFEASGVRSVQQARKIYPSIMLFLTYLFYIELTIW